VCKDFKCEEDFLHRFGAHQPPSPPATSPLRCNHSEQPRRVGCSHYSEGWREVARDEGEGIKGVREMTTGCQSRLTRCAIMLNRV
jgi:hypothetical protein